MATQRVGTNHAAPVAARVRVGGTHVPVGHRPATICHACRGWHAHLRQSLCVRLHRPHHDLHQASRQLRVLTQSLARGLRRAVRGHGELLAHGRAVGAAQSRAARVRHRWHHHRDRLGGHAHDHRRHAVVHPWQSRLQYSVVPIQHRDAVGMDTGQHVLPGVAAEPPHRRGLRRPGPCERPVPHHACQR